LGYFSNPEQLAYDLPAAKIKLYRVRFAMSEIWGGEVECATDTVDAEIYEHWIQKD
jgi:nitrile hydratase